jgi:hypothetical protein
MCRDKGRNTSSTIFSRGCSEYLAPWGEEEFYLPMHAIQIVLVSLWCSGVRMCFTWYPTFVTVLPSRLVS